MKMDLATTLSSFCLKALAILKECKASGQSGLTAETFTACTLIPVGNGGNDLPPH